MRISNLTVDNFRNHTHTTLQLSDGVNVLVGPNAQGKTNLLEAIYLSCVGRGWRTSRDSEMVQFGKDSALVQVTAIKKFGSVDIAIQLGQGLKKSISINRVPIAKVAELMGQINCIFFSPDELKLVKEAPADRRRFINIDLSQIDKSYFYALSRYNKILQQRNAYLKNRIDVRELSVWDEQLVQQGKILINKRQEFIRKLTPYVIAKHKELTGGKEIITITYETCNDLAQELFQARERDFRLRTTTVGPHRDDLAILINGQDVRIYGSQGQQRTVALSIKLAELDLFTAITGERPILLLDDVFSELDSSRQERLLTTIANTQVIITATDAPLKGKIFNVLQGSVIS
ncbi:MAG: DNA replication/repair protein RecF [Clostridia bacterium]|nr:DNA replication/repair protein RecF [Clostridia bacterium]